MDQGGRNSCLANATAASICTSAAANGYHIAYPSEAALWAEARLLELGKQDNLPNVGSRMRTMCTVVESLGIVEEDAYPYTDDNCYKPPPLDIFQKQIDMRLRGWYRPQTVDEVIASLHLGQIPVFGMDTDEAFYNLTGSATYVPGGADGTGHAQCIVGWDGKRFIVQGSYGTTFGDEGYIYLSPQFLMSSRVFDIMILPVSPKHLPFIGKAAA